ncbi:lysophospholipid acyltransferase family protein [Massilia sp. S19_KUP03_FR1]|uniref:lysophospholipid acyltransferase family protein n=1 Tax=Massilia sp. S19_KUP03_FR1 TaxID=3025503 RepID=UPI002FCD7708
MNWLARQIADAIVLSARLLTGAKARWRGCLPSAAPRVYFANHRSHVDFVLIRGCLPPPLRLITRPVAGADYWNASRLRRFIGIDVFNSLLISRCDCREVGDDPVAQMTQAVQEGDSLIVFPEGTRNTTDQALLPFKSGVYHLACACPDIEFVPVWIDNLDRVMPKGEWIPVPLLCTVTFGAPILLQEGEIKDQFLHRCRAALLGFAPSLE